jgi:chemotaxis protein CheX
MARGEGEKMLLESSVLIQTGDVAQIVASVFEAMLNLQAVENGTPWFADENRVTASVHLSGDWNGAVLIECDRDQACRFAGRFLSIDPPENLDDHSRDVLGELANMIGGNLKGILTRGIRLSLPSVVDGSSVRGDGGERTLRMTFRCEDGFFWVTVVTIDRQ